ncbi:MAG TPA: hypothetical protein PKG90_09950 [Chitinophagaceae bacterium]|nr:hypothetical protein [Chitinophagaceae bacterium]HNU15015.1 hypothetical protein [Chitinophagaceae bacterium]
MKRFTKISFITGSVLVAYGYLCRILNIYFFWDSKIIGWFFLFLALAGLFFSLYKSQKSQGKKTAWVKIGIGFLLFGLIISPIVIFILKRSDAYQAAIEYLKIDTEIKNTVGNIRGFGLIPTGQIESSTNYGENSGDAVFNITIRGDKKYKDVIVSLKKTPETMWTIVSLE